MLAMVLQPILFVKLVDILAYNIAVCAVCLHELGFFFMAEPKNDDSHA